MQKIVDLTPRDITGEVERQRRIERFRIKKQYLAIGLLVGIFLVWLTV